MAPAAPRLVLGLLVLSLCCEACKKVIFHVPSELEADTLVGRVDLKECLQSADFISSSDGNFKILEDGSVYTTSAVSLSAEKKTFSILLKDIQEHVQKKIHVSLVEEEKKTQTQKTRHARDTVLKRTKRRWGPIPSVMIENSLGPFPLQIQQVQSDTAQNYTIYYSASGPGIDQDPKGLFYIERETGNIFATRAVDREQYPSFQIICFATTPDGYSPEVPLVHTIRIEDDNDNAPYFTQDLFEFSVLENSKPGKNCFESVNTVTTTQLSYVPVWLSVILPFNQFQWDLLKSISLQQRLNLQRAAQDFLMIRNSKMPSQS